MGLVRSFLTDTNVTIYGHEARERDENRLAYSHIGPSRLVGVAWFDFGGHLKLADITSHSLSRPQLHPLKYPSENIKHFYSPVQRFPRPELLPGGERGGIRTISSPPTHGPAWPSEFPFRNVDHPLCVLCTEETIQYTAVTARVIYRRVPNRQSAFVYRVYRRRLQ